MILKHGKMLSRDIAEFFEISYDYYRRKSTKERYLTLLREYADFEEVYGGVIIKEVKNEEFIPPQLPLKELFERELKRLPASQYYEGHVYGTLLQIAADTLEEVNQMQRDKGMRVWTSVKTLANKYGAISKELYGERKFNQSLYENTCYYTPAQICAGRGPKGVRLSCMLIKTDAGLRELTKEEKELFAQISDDYDTEHEQELRREMLALREAAYASKYEDDKEAQAAIDAIEEKWAKDFSAIRQAFVNKTGLILVSRGTAWKDEEWPEYAFDVKQSEERG